MASPATRSHPSSSSPSSSETAGVHAKPVLVDEPGSSFSRSRQLDGKGLTIAIVFSRWYGNEVVDPLVEACKNELLDKGVSSSNVICVEVSGAFEIPFAASRLIQTKHDKLDAVICIGCMVKGATMAYEFVSEAVAMAVMKLNVMTNTPVIFGVLTCASANQAKQCATDIGGCCGSDKKCSHGVEWAQSALEMAHLKRCTAAQIAKKCKCKCHCESKNCNCSCHCTECKCKMCTCADCECVSCAGEKKATKPGSGGICTGCGKGNENCSCQGCNCSVCSQKTTRVESLP